MDFRKMNELMDKVKTDLGEGLLSSSIVSLSDGQSLIHSGKDDPVLNALATEATKYLVDALSSCSFGALGDYFMMDFPHNMGGLVLVKNGYWWGILFNKAHVSLGVLFNVILPDAVKGFREATS